MSGATSQPGRDAIDSLRILHLSDLHFTEEVKAPTLLQPLQADLRYQLNVNRLDYLVVSGDFTDKYCVQAFPNVNDFLKQLMTEFGVPADRVILTPGNHDCEHNLGEYFTALQWRPGTNYEDGHREGQLVLVPNARYANRFDGYREFYRSFYGNGREYAADPAQQFDLCTDPETGLTFLSLNSCWRVDELRPERAELNPDALSAALLAKERVKLGIVVWHHAVTGNRKVADTRAIERLALAGYRILLHGDVHQERDSLENYLDQDRRIHVVGGGAFGAAAKDRPESTPRLYTLLEMKRDLSACTVTRRRQVTAEAPYEAHPVGKKWKYSIRFGTSSSVVPDDRMKKKTTSALVAGDPAPPILHSNVDYVPGHPFVGRERELRELDLWAASAEPVMVFEAIGGMGKSMVTWEWLNRRAPGLNWAGMLWYSFYELRSDMHDFCVTALAYMAGKLPEDLRERKTGDLAEELLLKLKARRWLIVLDGLERILVGCDRHDAPQAADHEVESDPDRSGRKHASCIRPADDRLLRSLCAAGPSKILISSRLMPLSLLNPSGRPIPGRVRHYRLEGLAPAEAERVVRSVGVTGTSSRIQLYLQKQYGCHPLVVGVVAGIVSNFFPAPNDFDAWIDHPLGGADVNLAGDDFKQRRHNILKMALTGLTPDEKDLMTNLALMPAAADWEALEALNPKRPKQPDPVESPELPDATWDYKSRRLRRQLESATTEEDRETLRTALAARRSELEEQYQAAKDAFETYRSELEAWRRSAEVRAADRWLISAVLDLDKRGLVQWDPRQRTIDLHPVVRGAVFGLLTAEEKSSSGQKVADYFSSRSDLPYQEASSLHDLANGMAVVRALNLAGKVAEAFDVLCGGLGGTLNRLQLYEVWLELLRPLFPNGWLQGPTEIDDFTAALDDTALALRGVGRQRESLAAQQLSICHAHESGLCGLLAERIRGWAMLIEELGCPFQAEQSRGLARQVAKAVSADEQAWDCDLDTVYLLTSRAELQSARTLWDGLLIHTPRSSRLEAEALYVEALLLLREGKLDEDRMDSAIKKAEELRYPRQVRNLWRTLGLLRQSVGQHSGAVEACENAIALGRRVDVIDHWAEALLGVSLAHLGRREDAFAAAAQAEGTELPPHAPLAELYLLLGDTSRAREHALSGYRFYWADGPPYSLHWELEQCRRVLKAIGEAEPQLAAFDRNKMPPIPFEADILRLLEEAEAERRNDADN